MSGFFPEPILKDCLELWRAINVPMPVPDQLSLMHRDGCPEKYWHIDGVVPVPGLDDPDNMGQGNEDEIKHLDTRLPEATRNTLQMLQDMTGIARARLMSMNSRSCYTIHTDATPRAHIALQTHDKVWFIIEGAAPFHIPADGSVWIIDTTRKHTVVNGARDGLDRIHIVATVPHEFEEQFRARDLTK